MAASGPRAALATLAVTASWCLLALGDSWREGEFSPAAMSFAVAGFVMLLAVVVVQPRLVLPDRRVLTVAVAVCLGAAIVHPATRYMHVGGGRLLATEVLAGVTAGAVALSLLLSDRWSRRTTVLVAALAAVTGIVTVAVVDDPGIDVWYLLQQSSDGLLHGHNMYRQHWAHSNGLQDVYPYLPGTTLLLAPFRWLLGDVRYGLVLALLLSAWLLRRLAPAAPPALAALVLVMPHWTFLVDQSWTEPLLILALAATFVGIQEDRAWLAVLGLAVALACKQHIVLLLPLFAMWPSFGVRRTALSVGVAVLIVLPWFVAGPAAFWHDAVHANLALGVLTRALCLPSLFARWGVTVGFWFLLVVLVGCYAAAFRFLPRTTSGLALGSALVMWGLDLANKQSFFNHYTLPMGLLVAALASAEPTGERRNVGSARQAIARPVAA